MPFARHCTFFQSQEEHCEELVELLLKMLVVPRLHAKMRQDEIRNYYNEDNGELK
jgi:hypothetical protein